jgi:hypothetical protein
MPCIDTFSANFKGAKIRNNYNNSVVQMFQDKID